MADEMRFGYLFRPSRYDPPLGHAALDVFFSNHHAGWYFETETLMIPVVEGDKVMHLHAVHPWSGPDRFRVYLGRFFLQAHNGDLAQGATLGGELQIKNHGKHTSCHLTSSVPVFSLPEETTAPASYLITEVEAELARLQSEGHWSQEEFTRRVLRLKPSKLLAASLHLVDDFLHSVPHRNEAGPLEADREAVHRAIKSLQNAGEWPASPPVLRDLLYR